MSVAKDYKKYKRTTHVDTKFNVEKKNTLECIYASTLNKNKR